jgi:hypothetical protein
MGQSQFHRNNWSTNLDLSPLAFATAPCVSSASGWGQGQQIVAYQACEVYLSRFAAGFWGSGRGGIFCECEFCS